ncbi:outer membrane receptor protein involved in Fe transport [Sphingomonas naasensis]|uniref:TonB-dependent receptor n=1 Tax=Sphingomonas naasensis TaxID=1344951 RepID=A0A4V3QVB3_9SPHN|nr:TonB-dependent receptor [Sphingomonas naasensis]NIJ20017.1 outer membrane receptor protein involved in Fe transport [Sphingomonas naasensis]TGX37962.1 TonB-dependent receptor [Sphingomonas naasensis]
MIASPALAQERAAEVDISETRLDAAIRALSRQASASIGFREARLAETVVRPVRGRFLASQALERMLAGTGLRARRVAPATYLIEPAPARKVAKRSRPPVPVQAVAETPTQPVEITVTASKRDVPLGSYPGGVQIVSGSEFSAADALRGTEAIEARIASVASTHLGPGRNKLFIRGIADSSFVGPTQSTVGQYWGNSRITYSAPDPNLRLYDVQSVEVLEGPQGTLYGAGSLGGVVRVVPRSPDLRSVEGAAWGGVQAVQHGQPGVDGGAVLNLPIKEDVIGLRALAFGSVEGGYIDDVRRGLDDVNRVRTLGGRAGLRVDPGDDWILDLNAVGQRIDGDDSQYAERGVGELDRASSIAQPFRNDYWLVDLVARKQWGSLELTSSLGYAGQYVFERFEGPELAEPEDPGIRPAASAATAAYSQANRISMVTGEVRLARRGANGTGWLLAASLLHNEARTNRRMEVAFGTPLTGVSNQVEEATLYGEGTLEPFRRFTVTLGGRLTHARLSGSAEDVTEAFAFRMDPTARASREETRLLPSIAAAYRATDALTLFARFQQGFRPGGIAVRREFIQRFAGDRVSTAEAGARYRSSALDVAVSVAATRWTNIQADLIDGFGFPTTANAGDGRVLSLGMISRWRPIAGLELDAALYLNDSKVTERLFITLPIEDAVFVQADRLPNVADASGRVGASYVATLADGLQLTANAYARYVGKSTLGIGPLLGRLQGDYLDTGAEVRLGNARRGISLSLGNLLDARGNRFALGSPFLIRDRDQTTPLRPRSIRLGFDANF